MDEEPTRKTSLRRFLRGSTDKSKQSPHKASASKGPDACSVASSSSYPLSGQQGQSLKAAAASGGSTQGTPAATPPHKKHHPFGVLLRRDLHLHHFFNRHPQNSRRFSPPVTEQVVSPLANEAVSPSPAEAELSRALNQLSSVTR